MFTEDREARRVAGRRRCHGTTRSWRPITLGLSERREQPHGEDAAAQRAAQGQQSGAEDDGAKAPIPTNMPSDFKLRPVPELEAARDDYYRKASKEEEALSSRAPHCRWLGKELMARQTKVAELVASWAKRGEEPISKMEFRQQVRKYLETKDEKAEKGAKAEKIDIKEVDTLFESLDKDNSGTIGVPELRRVQEAAGRGIARAKELGCHP